VPACAAANSTSARRLRDVLSTPEEPDRTSQSPERLVERPVVIAVDGPSGSGKSTISRRLADILSGRYVDTGASYRALTWGLLERGVDVHDPDAVVLAMDGNGPRIELSTDPHASEVWVDGRDVSREIRGSTVTENVSAVAAVAAARTQMVLMQRQIAEAAAREGVSLVMEGRDIGAVVLPDADIKVWLTADVAARAARRAAEIGVLHAHEIHAPTDDGTGALGASAAPAGSDAAQVQEQLDRRDAHDRTRESSPALPAADAVVIDATHLDIDAVVAAVMMHLRNRLGWVSQGQAVT
jgi:CMP/dCMP kinase